MAAEDNVVNLLIFMNLPTINTKNGERLEGQVSNGAVLYIITLIRACAGALLIIR